MEKIICSECGKPTLHNYGGTVECDNCGHHEETQQEQPKPTEKKQG